ncbi:MAG: metal-dependent hydrolase [Nanoarchaeota archaeon]|nr:metal-dependent hydrolase [Nanoarchaeota archaeon]MBU4124147.1 metal-dependent hydrolase [Nanoarchaeota archaeon]
MDILFHFIFPIIAAIAAKVHIRHPIRNILIAATLTVLVDVDHLVGFTRGTFHNIFVLVLIPLLFVAYTFHRKKFYQEKGLAILIFIFLSSHLFLDLFTGGVALFYPLSTVIYAINFNIPLIWTNITMGQSYEGMLVSSLGVGIALYFLLIVLPCMYLDDIISNMEKKHENFRRALKDLRSKKPRNYYKYS